MQKLIIYLLNDAVVAWSRVSMIFVNEFIIGLFNLLLLISISNHLFITLRHIHRSTGTWLSLGLLNVDVTFIVIAATNIWAESKYSHLSRKLHVHIFVQLLILLERQREGRIQKLNYY